MAFSFFLSFLSFFLWFWLCRSSHLFWSDYDCRHLASPFCSTTCKGGLCLSFCLPLYQQAASGWCCPTHLCWTPPLLIVATACLAACSIPLPLVPPTPHNTTLLNTLQANAGACDGNARDRRHRPHVFGAYCRTGTPTCNVAALLRPALMFCTQPVVFCLLFVVCFLLFVSMATFPFGHYSKL